MAPRGPLEHVLAASHVTGSARADAIVAGIVGAGAPAAGLTDDQAGHLARAAGAVARAVLQRGFDDLEDAALDVTLLRVGHRAVVRIDDLGLPFNAAAEDEADADTIHAALAGGWIDALRHESLGRQGNRTVLLRHADPAVDLRHGDAAPPDPAVDEADRIGDDIEVIARVAEPADAEAICQLAWRTYGYSYQHDEYYQPDRLAAMLQAGLQASFVSTLPDGEIVGHSAVLLEEDSDVVVEGGRLMVDPRFRGHHLALSIREVSNRWMHEHGILALQGAAVTAHTRSQSDRAIASVQLAFLPPIQFRGIEATDVAHREAVLGGFVPIGAIPAQDVAAPRRDAEMIAEIYRRNELDRTIVDAAAAPAATTRSAIRLDVRADLGHAVLTCTAIGADLGEAVRTQVATAARSGIAVVYADLRLDAPTASWAADVLADEGFIFCGIVPLISRGTDVVRYQRLGDTVVDRDEIHLKTDFARELLDYVLAQREQPLGADRTPGAP